MKIFQCPNCQGPIFFENTECIRCCAALGYDLVANNFNALTDTNQLCINYQLGMCNWLADARYGKFCSACSLNRKVPNTSEQDNMDKWRHLETAKHRLVYQLHQLKLPLVPKSQDAQNGLAFDFVGENNPQQVTTGHANGVITIVLSEADSVHREQIRKQLSEPYRTLLGHFRHEIGHYYWMLLFEDGDLLEFRNLFGDERQNYSDSLQKHYKDGPPEDWSQHFISKYATAHPWEDWAETWAHYLHLMDTLETATSLGLSIDPEKAWWSTTNYQCQDPYQTEDFKMIFDSNVALTCVANSLNRSMGLPDIYPFILNDSVFTKLKFIHTRLNQSNEKG